MVALDGHMFDEVHPSKYDLEFNVSVIRIWEIPTKYNSNEIQRLEMVVQDHKGQRIHVGVGKGLVKKWRPHVREFNMYRMTSLMVVDPRMRPKLKTIQCPWYLIFSHKTTVELLDPPIFPCKPFHFRSVAEVLDDDIVEYLDIVGSRWRFWPKIQLEA